MRVWFGEKYLSGCHKSHSLRMYMVRLDAWNSRVPSQSTNQQPTNQPTPNQPTTNQPRMLSENQPHLLDGPSSSGRPIPSARAPNHSDLAKRLDHIIAGYRGQKNARWADALVRGFVAFQAACRATHGIGELLIFARRAAGPAP